MSEGSKRRSHRRSGRSTSQDWVRFLIAITLLSLVAGTIIVAGVSTRANERVLAAGSTPQTSLPFPVTPAYVIGGLNTSMPPATPMPANTFIPTDTPVPPTATPMPTTVPTATAILPTPTPDQGAAGIAPFVNGAVQVPVLMYHYIRVNPEPRDQVGYGLSVTPADFAAQMEWLVTNGYHTVLPGDLQDALTNGAALPTKPILLTFDDGYRDFYTAAWPILQQYGLKASVAIITAYADKGDAGDELYMNWDMIRTLDTSGMVAVASHTVFHADLTRATAAQRMSELSQSKATLEDKLAHPCQTFVYPSGMFNAAVVADAARVGYQIAFTTQYGKVRAPVDGGRMLTLPRVRVSGGETLASFAKDLG